LAIHGKKNPNWKVGLLISARNELSDKPMEKRLKTGIVVCRDLEGAMQLDPERLGVAGRCVLASDDPRVHVVARQLNWIEEVVFLERIESYFNVAADVLSILDSVNRWLAGLGGPKTIPQELLYWTQHVEGGDTTQRIQDALLLVNSYRGLFERFQPTEILVIRCPAVTWEDDLLFACAEGAGIRIRIAGSPGWRGWGRRIWPYWRPLAKEAFFASRTLAIRFRNFGRHKPKLDLKKLVVVQLCDSARKHLNHTRPLMKALDQVGLQGVVLCWGAARAPRGFRREQLMVVELESWVGIGRWLGSWIKTCRTWRQARFSRKDFLANEKPGSLGRLIRPVLLESVRAFILGELANRYRFDGACRRFFSTYPPRAARFWSRILPPGVIAYRALPSGCRPLLFWQPGWPYQVPSPYTRYDVPVELVFAISLEHQRILLHEGFTPEQTVLAGVPWLASMREFKKANGKTDSRKILNINDDTRLCLLCDAGSVLRGHMAPAEQACMLSALLELARDHPCLHLIVKPHPYHKPGLLEALLVKYPLSNLTVVPQGDLPHHALNASNVLITKYSTLALEGMVLDVPSIGVLLDGEEKFACYEDAMEYVYSIDQLKALVTDLLEKPGFRDDWIEKMRIKAAGYLQRHVAEALETSNDIIAGEIKKRIPC
jgi:hypothetical protein